MLVLHLSLSTYIHTYIHVYIPLQACFLGSVHFRWRRIRVNATFPAFSFLVLISQLVKVLSYTALIPWHGFEDIFSTDHISIFFFWPFVFSSFVFRLKSIAMLSSLLRVVMFLIKNPSWYAMATHMQSFSIVALQFTIPVLTILILTGAPKRR